MTGAAAGRARGVAVGVDIGTTSTKAVVYSAAGQVLGHHAVDYPLLRPEPGAAEQEPERIHEAVLQSIAGSLAASGTAPRSVLCVAFSAAMHSLILVDRDGAPLTRSITWADNRAAAAAERLRAMPGAAALQRRTGTPIHPMSPLAKLTWLRESQPALVDRAARFIGIKEYVLQRLFGEYAVDHSIASATGLFELDRLDWDAEALALAGVRPEQLSRPVPTTARMPGRLDREAAARLGLAAGTPFIVGANDGVLSNLGVGAIGPGEIAVTVGTSGAMRAVVDRPMADPSGRTFCYALAEGHWVVGGPVNNGGIVLRWLRDELAPAEAETARRLGLDPYELLSRMAERVPAGADGLLFHPYLAGERAPLWNANLRGSFFGLGLDHRKEHLVRAVMEGVMFNLAGLLPAVEALVGGAGSIRATGGFARSALWRQMMADVFDRELVVPESFESSCLGAAVLGLHALGRLPSLAAVRRMVGSTHRHAPDPERAAIYRELMPIHAALPVLLEAQYAKLAAFRARHVGGG